MRVLEVAYYPVPQPGSFVASLTALLEGARKREWSAELLLGESSRGLHWVEPIEARGIAVRFAPPGTRGEIAGWLRDVIDESPAATALHTHFARFDLAAARAALGRPAVEVFWHEHSVLNNSPTIAARNFAKFGLLSWPVNSIFCPSTDLASRLRQRLAPRRKVRVIHNAIDTERYRPPLPKPRALARSELGLPARGSVLLHYGHDWLGKGGDLFAEVVLALRNLGHDAVGLSVGGAEDARAAARALGISEHLRTIEPLDDVRDLLAAADIFISPSRGDTSPYAVQESLACGVPVIASDIPGHRVIAAGVAACSVVPNEVGALTDAAVALLSKDPRQMRADAAQARQRMQDEFSLANWSELILDAFDAARKSPR